METITVADMIAALAALPPDTPLVVTESGYYCYGEGFATISLPTPVDAEGESCTADNAVAWSIGHSHQSY